MTTTLPLRLRKKHLFLEIENQLWLIDTGSPVSFGNIANLELEGTRFTINSRYPTGLTIEDLCHDVGVKCVGLLGADVLNNFDFIFDYPKNKATLSMGRLDFAGAEVNLNMVGGTYPIFSAQLGVSHLKLVFDTGAPISYFYPKSLVGFTNTGTYNDFIPKNHRFNVQTCAVEIMLAGIKLKVCGGKMEQADTIGKVEALQCKGILGNEILAHRQVGYFPRRALLVI